MKTYSSNAAQPTLEFANLALKPAKQVFGANARER